MAARDHLGRTNVLKEKINMQSIFCMGIRTLHKLEDGFSHQRPKEIVITIAEAL